MAASVPPPANISVNPFQPDTNHGTKRLVDEHDNGGNFIFGDVQVKRPRRGKYFVTFLACITPSPNEHCIRPTGFSQSEQRFASNTNEETTGRVCVPQVSFDRGRGFEPITTFTIIHLFTALYFSLSWTTCYWRHRRQEATSRLHMSSMRERSTPIMGLSTPERETTT